MRYPIAGAMALALGLTPSTQARPSPFTTVPLDHWAYAQLEKTFALEGIQGYDGPFHGGQVLTREQLARVLREVLRQVPDPAALPVLERARLRRLSGEFSHELDLLGNAMEVRSAWASAAPTPPSVATPPAVAVAATPAAAEPATAEPAAAKPKVEADSRLRFEGQVRVRTEYNDNYDFNSALADSRDFTELRTTLGIHYDRSDRYKAFIQLRDSRAFGGERGATGGIPGNTVNNQANVDMHQGYVDYYPGADDKWRLRLGRQEINLGDQRIVGALDWTNVARSFDGLRVTGKVGEATLDAFHYTVGANTVSSTGPTGPDGQILAGVQAAWKLDEHTLETYLLHFKDRAALNARSSTGVLGAQSWETFGVRALGPLGDSDLDYKFELAAQRGDFSTDDLSAEALAIQLGYDAPGGEDRFELAFDYSPGDEGKTGERGTWQTLFPTNHIHYGIADRVAWQNIRAIRATWKRKLGGARSFRADLWKFDLDDTRDAWYGATGAAIRPARAGAPRDLGHELDLRYSWKDGPMKHELGLARFFGGDFQSFTSPALRSDDATFAYWMMIFPL